MLLNDLPDDCLWLIFDNFSGLEDLIRLSQVCSKWSNLVSIRFKRVKYLVTSEPIDHINNSKIWTRDPIDTLKHHNLRELLPNLRIVTVVDFLPRPQLKPRHYKKVINNNPKIKGLIGLRNKCAVDLKNIEMIAMDHMADYRKVFQPDQLKQIYFGLLHVNKLPEYVEYFPNLKRFHVFLYGSDWVEDCHVEELVQLLPQIKLLDFRESDGVTVKSADFLSKFCLKSNRSIKIYYDCEKEPTDWPKLDTPRESIILLISRVRMVTSANYYVSSLEYRMHFSFPPAYFQNVVNNSPKIKGLLGIRGDLNLDLENIEMVEMDYMFYCKDIFRPDQIMPINNLPDECLWMILNYFDELGQLIQLSEVCLKWYTLISVRLKKVKYIVNNGTGKRIDHRKIWIENPVVTFKRHNWWKLLPNLRIITVGGVVRDSLTRYCTKLIKNNRKIKGLIGLDYRCKLNLKNIEMIAMTYPINDIKVFQSSKIKQIRYNNFEIDLLYKYVEYFPNLKRLNISFVGDYGNYFGPELINLKILESNSIRQKANVSGFHLLNFCPSLKRFHQKYEITWQY
ncbi:uncharacterized protein LOC128386256 [Panonychus citri]|uniref:uncharacterized protein LOC128386256 n=1 Tax=Panonychus citri TaxID=50023 RepID=UPI00230725F2|nr:uncharacterized protein LOC128386256 [Panonychus citri]